MLSIPEIAHRTSGAYSRHRYYSWNACIKALRKEGFDDEQVEAILCSKLTRWAADRSKAPHGKASSKDLLRYMHQFETADSLASLFESHRADQQALLSTQILS